MTCGSNEQKQDGLCYKKCDSDQEGGGPLCWQKCSGSVPTECGAMCTKNASKCASTVGGMVITGLLITIGVALGALAIVATGGAGVAASVWIGIVISLAIYSLVPTQSC